MFRRPVVLASLLLLVAGCGSGHHHHLDDHSQVSLVVVVHDKDGFAWENVEVRILEAWNEWSACVCKGKEPWSVDFTDRNGEVVFDPRTLALAELGFAEIPDGVAVLGSHHDEDEAILKLIVGHDSLGWVRVDVPLSFHDPHVELFVELN